MYYYVCGVPTIKYALTLEMLIVLILGSPQGNPGNKDWSSGLAKIKSS